MSIIQKSILALCMMVTVVATLPHVALAADNNSDEGTSTSKCGGVDTAIIKCDQDGGSKSVEDNAIWGLLLIAINILTAGVGILAVGGMVYGALLYATAEDKADQVKKSIDIITNVAIGLVAFALMWAGLNFLIPGGLFA